MSPRYDRRRFVRSAVAGAAAATVPALPAPTEAASAAPHSFDFDLVGLITRSDGTQAVIHLDIVDGVGTIRHQTGDRGRPVTIDPGFAAELFRLADH